MIEVRLTFQSIEDAAKTLKLLAATPVPITVPEAPTPPSAPQADSGPESTPATTIPQAAPAPAPTGAASIEPTLAMLSAAVRAHQKARGTAATAGVLAPYRRASEVPTSEYGKYIAKLAL